MNQILNEQNAPLMAAIMLEWQGTKSADYGELMTKTQRYAFVLERHKWAITQLQGGVKEGTWKTYIMVQGKRQGITRKSRDDLMDALYDYYQNGEKENMPFSGIYEEMLGYKRDTELVADKTLADYRDYYRRFMQPLGGRKISTFTEDMLRRWIVEDVLPQRPRDTVFKRLLLYVRQALHYAVKRRYIPSNPMEFIEYREYQKHCSHIRKADEDTYFTAEEIGRLREDMLRHTTNPRALIVLLNIEMGMRADEPVVIHWEDVHKDYICIHRQQIRQDGTQPISFVEVDYTKDTRCKTGPERRFPITPRIREILNLADQLPGESIYLFHDKDGQMITKDSYEQYLRRQCQRLGLRRTNNHSIRRAVNNNVFIPAGFSANERAALLGHTARTNEQNYSNRRADRLNEMGSVIARIQENQDRAARNSQELKSETPHTAPALTI